MKSKRVFDVSKTSSEFCFEGCGVTLMRWMIRLGGEVFRNGERTYGGCVLFRTDAKKKK